MGRICETVVKVFTEIFFGQKKLVNNVEKKDVYTLTSVFPTEKIMMEAKKYL